MTRLVSVSRLSALLLLFPVGASGQGVTSEGIPDRTTIMTEEDFQDAARRGINLAAALEDAILGLWVGGGVNGWCVEYRQIRWPGKCNSVTLYVDGARVADEGYLLGLLSVDDIARAEILSAIDATTRYGAAGGYGALLKIFPRMFDDCFTHLYGEW